MKRRHLIPLALVSLLVLGVYGCGSPDSDSADTSAATATPSAAVDEHDGHDHADHDHGNDDTDAAKTDMEKMTEQLASLSAEDRESAMKQHFCPISGEMLGTMGTPEKVDVNGQAVWICCDGCKDKLLADPDKYLQQLATAGDQPTLEN